jgi:hypothetical protein
MGKCAPRLARDFWTQCPLRIQTHKSQVSYTDEITVKNKTGFKTSGPKTVYNFFLGGGGWIFFHVVKAVGT